MATKVAMVIVNRTKYVLNINVGTNCSASLKAGGEYKIHVDVNWTFQEFVLELDSTDMDHNTLKLTVNSDDCCDYRCITVTEMDGKLDALREPRQQSADANSQVLVEAVTSRWGPSSNGIRNLLSKSSWKMW